MGHHPPAVATSCCCCCMQPASASPAIRARRPSTASCLCPCHDSNQVMRVRDWRVGLQGGCRGCGEPEVVFCRMALPVAMHAAPAQHPACRHAVSFKCDGAVMVRLRRGGPYEKVCGGLLLLGQLPGALHSACKLNSFSSCHGASYCLCCQAHCHRLYQQLRCCCRTCMRSWVGRSELVGAVDRHTST
jgi:hypothetical protein